MSETDTKKHRRGGRERRDPNAKITGPAYITRNIPTYDILGEENLLKIEASADRLMAEVGIDIRDDDACLALFKKQGPRWMAFACGLSQGTYAKFSRQPQKNSPSTHATRRTRCKSAARAWCLRRPMAHHL